MKNYTSQILDVIDYIKNNQEPIEREDLEPTIDMIVNKIQLDEHVKMNKIAQKNYKELISKIEAGENIQVIKREFGIY